MFRNTKKKIPLLMFFVLTYNQLFNFFTQQKSPEINRGLMRSIEKGSCCAYTSSAKILKYF